MSWDADIRRVFAFTPPTDDAVKARHQRVREAEENAVRIVREQYLDLVQHSRHQLCDCESGPGTPLVDGRFCTRCGCKTAPAADPLVAERTPEHRFALINDTLLGFALVIDEVTPMASDWEGSSDLARTKRAAIEAVQLARNGANEALLHGIRHVQGSPALNMNAAVDASVIFVEQMRIARYRASTVIALSASRTSS